MGVGLGIGIIGPSIFTIIVIFGLVQTSEFLLFIPIAVASWSGVALVWKWRLIAGIVQIVIGTALPVVFYFIAEAIDPGSFGAALGLILIAFLCSIPFIVSGIILIISWIRERNRRLKNKLAANKG